jgi:uncharacterized protein RhaS with RHS repeats
LRLWWTGSPGGRSRSGLRAEPADQAGRQYERLSHLGETTELPIGHAQMLRASGYVEGATDRDASWLDYDQLLHTRLVHPSGRDDATARWNMDEQGRLTPVPDG